MQTIGDYQLTIDDFGRKTTTYTQTMKRIDEDWKNIYNSRKTIEELEFMINNHSNLSNMCPQKILDLVSTTKNVSAEERNPILVGLFDFVDEFELAGRLILQSLRPQIDFLIRNTYFADVEERASTILSVAIERIMSWRPTSPEFCHFNLYQAISRSIRNGARKWNLWNKEQLGLDFSTFESKPESKSTDLNELIEWIIDIAKIDRETAVMLVLTRTGYLTINHFSESSGVSPQTLRQRRSRAEISIRKNLSKEGYRIAI